MAHLTYFDTIEEYNAYINSEDYVKPNISYCADVDVVFMKEDFIPSVTMVYNIPSAGSRKIANSTGGIKAIRIDGQILAQNVTTYTFTSAGEHTVEYQFRKQNSIPSNMFYDGTAYTSVTSVNLSNIKSIGDKNLYGFTNAQFGDLVFNGNLGNDCFGAAYKLTSVVVNGNIGNGNFGAATALTSVTINGNMGDGNVGSCNSLTDLYVDGNIGSGNAGGVASLTSVTINGNVGGGNFGGCNSIEVLNIGGTVMGGGNFNSGGSKYRTINVGGDIEQGNSFYCNNNRTTEMSVSGNVNGGGTTIHSGNTLTINGNIGNPSIRYWEDVTINGSITGSGTNFEGVQNVVISGDVTGNGVNWYQGNNVQCQSFTIGGSITSCCNFNGMTSPIMVDVGGSIANSCFQSINITDRTSYTVHGNLGNDCFNWVTGLTDVTIEGSVGTNCFDGANSITSLTLTNACETYGGYTGSSSTHITKLTINRTTPPTFSNTVPTTDFQIFVPASAVDTYKAASGWSTYASQIEAIPNE